MKLLLAHMNAIAVCVMMFAGNVCAQDKSLFEKAEFIDGRDTLRYRVLYPEGYVKGKQYPLVLFLHGGGERGRDNQAQLQHGVNRFLEPYSRARFKCIVIAPQCPPGQSWNSMEANRSVTPIERTFDYKRPEPRPLQMSIALLRKFISEGAVNRKQVYITGLSMGGMGTFEAVGRYPELFKAAASVCGGGDAAAYGPRQAKVDFWIFHGTDDDVVDVKYSRQMADRLKALKNPVKYSEYPNVKHDSWVNAYAEPEFLTWMFRK